MLCPQCQRKQTRVVDSRPHEFSIRRRRECNSCKHRFTTYERIEAAPVTVTKRDGRTEPFDREKITAAIKTACNKRPVAERQIEALVTSVATEVQDGFDGDVKSTHIGRIILEHLIDVDKVAYMRFYSVFDNFQNPSDFEMSARGLDKPALTQG